MADREVSALLGETLTSVHGMEPHSGAVDFETASGRAFRLYHEQDCCESVAPLVVVGNVADLLGSPLLRAEVVSGPEWRDDDEFESFTWTFYHFATVRGSVTLRWLGTSNGYYSESVDFEEVPRG